MWRTFFVTKAAAGKRAPVMRKRSGFIAHKDTPDLDLANALRGFALLRTSEGERDEAVALWREARSLYNAVNVQPGVAESDRQIELLSAGT